MMLFVPMVGLLTLLSSGAKQGVEQDGTESAEVLQRLERLEQENETLRLQIDAIAGQMEQAEFSNVLPEVGISLFGMGPAASKVYQARQGFSFGGYGEAFYRHEAGANADQADFLRAVLYSGYKFDDNWIFNSEIEFEHASTDKEGSASVEFAYLEYNHSPALNVRTGLVLPPLGFINELHEPTTYYGVSRPETERRIIPSTWRENGIGVLGDLGGFSYKAYVVNGFDGSGFSASGLRGGRQKGSKASAEDLAFAGRLDWTETPGLVAGISAYLGDSGQGDGALGSVGTSIVDLHAEYQRGPWRLRGLAVQAEVDDTQRIFAENGRVVGEEMTGGYLEAGVDLLHWFEPGSPHSLVAFYRHEILDTHASVASGLTSDPSQDETIQTIGLNWFPVSTVVFKVDYQDFDKGNDRFQVSMGYVF